MDGLQGATVAAGADLVVGTGNRVGFRGIRTPAGLVEFPVVELGESAVGALVVSEGSAVELRVLEVEADLCVDEGSELVEGKVSAFLEVGRVVGILMF